MDEEALLAQVEEIMDRAWADRGLERIYLQHAVFTVIWEVMAAEGLSWPDEQEPGDDLT